MKRSSLPLRLVNEDKMEHEVGLRHLPKVWVSYLINAGKSGSGQIRLSGLALGSTYRMPSSEGTRNGFRSISLNLIYRDYQSHIANEGFTIGKEILGRPIRSHSQGWHILQYHKKRFTRHKKDRKHELIDLKGR
ncbi:hypothetical protein YC2023_085369 [Brassica napus]